jgi:hypothetical protein
MNTEIARTILSQLGGNRFAVMTGSKKFTPNESGLFFYVGRNSKAINYCRVTLTGADLYDVEYGFVRNCKVNVKATSQGLYADQLQGDFTEKTGLYTRFGG